MTKAKCPPMIDAGLGYTARYHTLSLAAAGDWLGGECGAWRAMVIDRLDFSSAEASVLVILGMMELKHERPSNSASTVMVGAYREN